MKRSQKNHDDDLNLLDSINRMSRQMKLQRKNTAQPEKTLLPEETIEDLEEQVESIRNSQKTHNHSK